MDDAAEKNCLPGPHYNIRTSVGFVLNSQLVDSFTKMEIGAPFVICYDLCHGFVAIIVLVLVDINVSCIFYVTWERDFLVNP